MAQTIQLLFFLKINPETDLTDLTSKEKSHENNNLLKPWAGRFYR